MELFAVVFLCYLIILTDITGRQYLISCLKIHRMELVAKSEVYEKCGKYE